MDTVAGARNLAIEREEQCDGVLGHGIRRVGGDPRDRKAEFLRRGDVNSVEAGAPQSYVFDVEFPKSFEAEAIGAVVDENADRLPAVSRVCGLSGEAAFHETPCDVVSRGGSLEWFAIVGFSVEDDSLDHKVFFIALFEADEEAGSSGGGNVAELLYRCPGSIFHTRSQ